MNGRCTVRIARPAIREYQIKTGGRNLPSATIINEVKYYLRHHEHYAMWQSQGWLNLQYSDKVSLHLSFDYDCWTIDRLWDTSCEEMAA